MKSGQAHRAVVTRRHPRHYQFLLLGVSLIALLSLVLGYFIGITTSPEQMISVVKDRSEETIAISIYNDLESEVAVLRAQSAVNRAALTQLRDDLSARESKISDLETSLSFFRSLMVSGNLAKGLELQSIEFIDLGDARHFGFRIIVLQQAKKHNLIKGTLTASVFGTRKGQIESHTLASLSQELQEDIIPLRFRYFQKISGEIALPKDFNPQGIDAIVRSSYPTKVTVKKKLPWLTTERFLPIGE